MGEQPALRFAGLLRQLRAEAGLTQEELAEAAGLSPRSVSDLERGINRTARKDTAVLLGGALGLAEPVRSLFVAAARGRIPAAQVLAARRGQAPGESPASAGGMHGFVPALTSFVGRAGPVREVAGLLDRGRLVTVTGPGGTGKTRLAAEVARQMSGRYADGAWLVELAPVAGPAQVAAVAAAALGVREQPGVPAAEAVAQVLARQQPRAQRRGPADHVLAVIQHQQQLLPGQHPRQHLFRRHPRLLPHPQRRRHHRRNQRRITGRRQLHQPRPVREPAPHLDGHLASQPGLAHTPGSGHRDQPVLLQQARDLAHRPVPADETRQLGREPVHATRRGDRRGHPHVRTITAGRRRRTARPRRP